MAATGRQTAANGNANKVADLSPADLFQVHWDTNVQHNPFVVCRLFVGNNRNLDAKSVARARNNCADPLQFDVIIQVVINMLAKLLLARSAGRRQR